MSGRILVVRLGAMGDILHALPAVASLKRSRPERDIDWAVEPRWLPLLEGNPDIARTVAVNRRSVRGVVGSIRNLRQETYAVAVDFQGLIKSALTATASGADEIVGFDASVLRERSAAILYTRTVVPRSAHVVDWNLELAMAAGARERVAAFAIPQGRPEGTLPEGPFVLANPLAGWASKQWPLGHYDKLAKKLRGAGYELVLNVPEGTSIEGAYVHVSGLAGLIDATRRAAAVVGVDSGPLHLAAALRKAGVAIFGPTDPARNGPYGGTMAVLREPDVVTSYKRRAQVDESMRAISPEQVWAALEPQLQH